MAPGSVELEALPANGSDQGHRKMKSLTSYELSG
jgi:hypothetical protein